MYVYCIEMYIYSFIRIIIILDLGHLLTHSNLTSRSLSGHPWFLLSFGL